MTPQFLERYNRELRHLRLTAGEFAAEYPRVAGKLGLDAFECADPYVERLLEGFAFMAARVQSKIDAEYPRFTQHLLDVIAPDLLAPVPSITISQFLPDRTQAFAEGVPVPRGTTLEAAAAPPGNTTCEFRTTRNLTLWPLAITSASYHDRGAFDEPFPDIDGVQAALSLSLSTLDGGTLDRLPITSLPIFLRGGNGSVVQEQCFANLRGIALRFRDDSGRITLLHEPGAITTRLPGFDDDEAVLPVRSAGFSGHRLLREYFACPDAFRFVELTGLDRLLSRCDSDSAELLFLFDTCHRSLERSLRADDFALHCVPAVNLFPKRLGRVAVNRRQTEFHLVPDRTRPLDFEVHSLRNVTGFHQRPDEPTTFRPFYSSSESRLGDGSDAFFSMRREPRVASRTYRSSTPHASPLGSEVYLSLVDASEAPYPGDLYQLSIEANCTNRHLCDALPLGSGPTDFHLRQFLPVTGVRAIVRPSAARESVALRQPELGWRLVNHLSIDQLGFSSDDPVRNAGVLRDLLALHSETADPAIRKQVSGILGLQIRSVTERLPLAGPIAFGRGAELELLCEESAFAGEGVFLLGAIFEHFFARFSSINSFTKTTLMTSQRGEVMRWPTRIGCRPTL